MLSDLSLRSILTISKGLISLGNKTVDHMNRKQLIESGEAKQQEKNLREALNAISKAIIIRRNYHNKFKSNGMPDEYKHYRKK